jgi:hypothetical protein
MKTISVTVSDTAREQLEDVKKFKRFHNIGDALEFIIDYVHEQIIHARGETNV